MKNGNKGNKNLSSLCPGRLKIIVVNIVTLKIVASYYYINILLK